jgi:hypothetical protein
MEQRANSRRKTQQPPARVVVETTPCPAPVEVKTMPPATERKPQTNGKRTAPTPAPVPAPAPIKKQSKAAAVEVTEKAKPNARPQSAAPAPTTAPSAPARVAYTKQPKAAAASTQSEVTVVEEPKPRAQSVAPAPAPLAAPAVPAPAAVVAATRKKQPKAVPVQPVQETHAVPTPLAAPPVEQAPTQANGTTTTRQERKKQQPKAVPVQPVQETHAVPTPLAAPPVEQAPTQANGTTTGAARGRNKPKRDALRFSQWIALPGEVLNNQESLEGVRTHAHPLVVPIIRRICRSGICSRAVKPDRSTTTGDGH